MQPGGALAGLFGGLVGVGPGAGIGLIFVLTALLGATFAALGYLIPAIRNIEEILPDYGASPQPTTDPAEQTELAPI